MLHAGRSYPLGSLYARSDAGTTAISDEGVSKRTQKFSLSKKSIMSVRESFVAMGLRRIWEEKKWTQQLVRMSCGIRRRVRLHRRRNQAGCPLGRLLRKVKTSRPRLPVPRQRPRISRRPAGPVRDTIDTIRHLRRMRPHRVDRQLHNSLQNQFALPPRIPQPQYRPRLLNDGSRYSSSTSPLLITKNPRLLRHRYVPIPHILHEHIVYLHPRYPCPQSTPPHLDRPSDAHTVVILIFPLFVSRGSIWVLRTKRRRSNLIRRVPGRRGNSRLRLRLHLQESISSRPSSHRTFDLLHLKTYSFLGWTRVLQSPFFFPLIAGLYEGGNRHSLDVILSPDR